MLHKNRGFPVVYAERQWNGGRQGGFVGTNKNTDASNHQDPLGILGVLPENEEG
jgi:hypothetical protein